MPAPTLRCLVTARPITPRSPPSPRPRVRARHWPARLAAAPRPRTEERRGRGARRPTVGPQRGRRRASLFPAARSARRRAAPRGDPGRSLVARGRDRRRSARDHRRRSGAAHGRSGRPGAERGIAVAAVAALRAASRAPTPRPRRTDGERRRDATSTRGDRRGSRVVVRDRAAYRGPVPCPCILRGNQKQKKVSSFQLFNNEQTNSGDSRGK